MRNHYIDALKGFAALNIVFIHTVFNSGVDYVPDWVRAVSLAVDVPFFFFLSGWAVALMPGISVQKTFKSLWRTYVQWVIFVVVTFAVMLVVAKVTTVPLGSKRDFGTSFLGNLVLENPNTPLPFYGVMGGGWFLVVYFAVVPVMSAAIALARRYTDSLRPVLILLLICLIGFVRVQSGGAFFFFGQYFLCYSVFFLLGFLQRDIRLRAWQSIAIVGLAVLGMAATLAVRGARFIDMQSLKFAPTLPWMCYALVMIVLAMSVKRWQYRVKGRGPLNWIGKNALQFFFTNAVAASIVIWIAPHVHLAWVPKLVVCYAITLSITAAFVLLFNPLTTLMTRATVQLRDALLPTMVFDLESMRTRAAQTARAAGQQARADGRPAAPAEEVRVG